MCTGADLFISGEYDGPLSIDMCLKAKLCVTASTDRIVDKCTTQSGINFPFIRFLLPFKRRGGQMATTTSIRTFLGSRLWAPCSRIQQSILPGQPVGQRLLFSTTSQVTYAKPASKKGSAASVEPKALLGRPSNNLKSTLWVMDNGF